MRLGAFDVLGPLGQGGMGTVWAGRHRASGLPVALKTLSARHAASTPLQAAFAREVRAVAGLDHAHVVRVYDQGRVQPHEAAPGLEPGMPWLAMEQLSGGSLLPLCGSATLPQVRTILEQLLSALAHAHAHGVLHRDIKPANVLLAGSGGAAVQSVRLTDFGLAHAMSSADAAASGRLAAGTPAWMPPEQAAGAWREQGPWTDLYAAGRLAWALVTGGPRAVGAGLPPGLARWIARCCMPEPADRFRHAADALAALGDVDGSGPPAPRAPAQAGGSSGPTLDLSGTSDLAGPQGSEPTLDLWQLEESAPSRLGARATGASEATWVADLPPLPAPAAVEPTPVEPMPRPLPPAPPTDWRALETAAPPGRQLAETGLGLMGLRAIPFVGRAALRDALWAELRATRTTGTARVVVVRGVAGVGKSRLAEWFCRRAEECGAAVVFRATHAEGGGAGDGLGPMLQRRLSLQGLQASQALARVAASLGDAAEARALVGTLELPGEALAVRYAQPDARLDAVRRAVDRAREGRVAVVWLDDAHWGRDALALARLVRERAGAEGLAPAPLLLLLTAREEALSELPEAAAALDDLAEGPAGRRLDVQPLDDEALHQVLAALPGLEAGLARALVERAGGSPLFAVQLVADWVQRGLLEVGPGGFRLVAGADTSLPDDLGDTWRRRLDRLLAALPGDAAGALARAAALGMEVRLHEWQAACGAGRAPALEPLRQALLEAWLARPLEEEEGWRFVHGMLRDVVLDDMRQRGEAPRVHADCAAALPGASRAERRGRHLAAAGRFDEAGGALLEATDHLLRRGEPHRAAEALTQAGAAIAARGVSTPDRLSVEEDVARARVTRLHRDLDGCVDIGRAAARRAEALGLPALQAEALGEVGAALRLRRGELAEGELQACLALAEQSGAERVAVHAIQDLAYVELFAGRVEAAERRILAGHPRAAALGEPLELGDSWRLLAQLHRQRGDHAATLHAIEQAMGCFEAAGYQAGLADLQNILGDLHRLAGRLDDAAAAYQESMRICTRIVVGHRDPYPRINLAQVDLERGAWADAAAALDAVRPAVVAMDNQALLGVTDTFAAVAAMGLGDEAGAARLLAEGRRRMASAGFHDVDVAVAAERGAALARDARLAQAFADVAAAHRRALGMPPR